MEIKTIGVSCPVCNEKFVMSYYPEAGNVYDFHPSGKTRFGQVKEELLHKLEMHLIMNDEKEYVY